ncbi:hypothetical protein BCR35DRAFT_182060 [Leucosporidium creatinivorum]|uniref:Uncharacterized protein n=1 Tax=Leucosporidium creatinivorum TaxID=106004 RepID=A0A1Y2E7G7_9BASI|nr:hypothetical protein BCR35DRAFT_182060 [Leucosporidium creatinivorum]
MKNRNKAKTKHLPKHSRAARHPGAKRLQLKEVLLPRLGAERSILLKEKSDVLKEVEILHRRLNASETVSIIVQSYPISFISSTAPLADVLPSPGKQEATPRLLWPRETRRSCPKQPNDRRCSTTTVGRYGGASFPGEDERRDELLPELR